MFYVMTSDPAKWALPVIYMLSTV